MHIGLKTDGLADVFRIAPITQELVEEAFAPCRVSDGDAGHVAGLAQDIVALTDIVGTREVQKIGVIDKARYLKPCKALHLLLELYDLLRALGHGAEDVDDIINLKLPILKGGKIRVISAE